MISGSLWWQVRQENPRDVYAAAAGVAAGSHPRNAIRVPCGSSTFPRISGGYGDGGGALGEASHTGRNCEPHSSDRSHDHVHQEGSRESLR